VDARAYMCTGANRKKCRDPSLGTFASRRFRFLRMTALCLRGDSIVLTRKGLSSFARPDSRGRLFPRELLQFALEMAFDDVEKVVAIV
jgi:hypothetical protein